MNLTDVVARGTEDPRHARRRADLLPSVLVVEDKAHRTVGHWPVLFAEVASGFAAVGCRVAVLTSRGWCLEGETDVPFSVYRYGWLATKLDGLAFRLRQNQLSGRWRDWLRRAGYVLRVVVIARAAATRAARDGPRHRRRRTERRRRARSHCCVRWSRPLAVVRLVLSPSPRNGGQRLRPPRRPSVGGDDRALSAGPWRPQRCGYRDRFAPRRVDGSPA